MLVEASELQVSLFCASEPQRRGRMGASYGPTAIGRIFFPVLEDMIQYS